jgi:hypothetical protein
MDFRVGKTAPVSTPSPKTAAPTGPIEAKVLAVRPARNRTGQTPPQVRERRGQSTARDPRNGRVLVLMIPDGQQLPASIEKGGYRVFVRFVRR